MHIAIVDYGMGNLQTIAQIQITNANVDLKQNYRCIIQGWTPRDQTE